MTKIMSLFKVVHLFSLVYLTSAECEFYMVGNTKWVFPTTGEVRKLWLRTALDNVNITVRFNFNADKNLYDHENWLRNPLKNTWYELELQQNSASNNAVVMVHNNQNPKIESWQLPHKRYDNIAVDADEHVLLSICDPQSSGINTVIDNCASRTFSTSVGIQSDKIDKSVSISTGETIFPVTTSILSASSEDLSESSPSSSVIFSAGSSPFLGLVIVLGLSIILNIILSCIAFRRRTSLQQDQTGLNQSIENIYENDITNPRHSAAFYNQSVQHRGIENIYENPSVITRHSTFPRTSTLPLSFPRPNTLPSTLSKQEQFKGSHQIYSIDNAGFIPSNDMA